MKFTSLIITFLLVQNWAHASSFTSSPTTQVEDWNSNNFWVGSSPGYGTIHNDDITIVANSSLITNQGLSVNNNTTITINGNLTINGDLDVNNGIELIVNGNLTITGSINIHNNGDFHVSGSPNGTVNVNGDLIFGNNPTGDIDGELTIGGSLIMNTGDQILGDGTVDITGTGCVDFWGGPSNNCSSESETLPVELISFDIKHNYGVNILTWTTAEETNNSHFDIEKSLDGANFYVIGKITGSGSSQFINHYEFQDSENNASYYRLKQVDFNETFSYSDVLFTKNTKNTISTYPSPVSINDMLNITFTKAENIYEINILNTTGKLISSISTIDKTTNINLAALGITPGNYVIQIIQKDEIISKVITVY